jgi:hypothetical protein
MTQDIEHSVERVPLCWVLVVWHTLADTGQR